MSVCTIVEFNHDIAPHAIRSHPDEFTRLLGAALNSGYPGDWDALKRFGVHAINSSHHSAGRAVTVDGRSTSL